MGVFEKVVAWDDELLEFIPQRSPIVMVDKLYAVEEKLVYTGLTVKADNLFCENGFLNESGLIEHVAQSAAVRIGYLCKQDRKPVPVGFIGALKNFEISGLPKVGDELHTTVAIMQEVFGITLATAEVRVSNNVILTGEMKIVIKQDEQEGDEAT